MSAGSNSSMAAAAAAALAAEDRAIWVARNKEYSYQLWWFVASFIGLLAIAQLLSWFSARLFTPPCPSPLTEKHDPEGRGVAHARRFSWSRMPIALVNYFRVLAFRNTVDIGEKYSFTYAEAFITVGYLVAIFTWEFVNSAYSSFVLLCAALKVVNSDGPFRQPFELYLLVGESRGTGRQPVPFDNGAWDEEQ